MLHFLGTFDRQRPTRVQRRLADVIDIARMVKPVSEIKVSSRGLTNVVLEDICIADFRRSEKTIYEDYVRQFRKKNYSWTPNHTVLFINNPGTMALWIMGVSRINNTIVLDSRKWRMVRGGELWFTTANLQYYANQVGFQLVLPDAPTIVRVLKTLNHVRRAA